MRQLDGRAAISELCTAVDFVLGRIGQAGQHDGEAELLGALLIRRQRAVDRFLYLQRTGLARIGELGFLSLAVLNSAGIAGFGGSEIVVSGFCYCIGDAGGQAGGGLAFAVLQRNRRCRTVGEGHIAVGAVDRLIAQRDVEGEGLLQIRREIRHDGLAYYQVTRLARIGERRLALRGADGAGPFKARRISREIAIRRFCYGIPGADRQSGDFNLLIVRQLDGRAAISELCTAVDFVLGRIGQAGQHDGEAELLGALLIRRQRAVDRFLYLQRTGLARIGELGFLSLAVLNSAGIAGFGGSEIVVSGFCYCIGDAGGQAGGGLAFAVLQRNRRCRTVGEGHIAVGAVDRLIAQRDVEGEGLLQIRREIRHDGLADLQVADDAGVGDGAAGCHTSFRFSVRRGVVRPGDRFLDGVDNVLRLIADRLGLGQADPAGLPSFVLPFGLRGTGFRRAVQHDGLAGVYAIGKQCEGHLRACGRIICAVGVLPGLVCRHHDGAVSDYALIRSRAAADAVACRHSVFGDRILISCICALILKRGQVLIGIGPAIAVLGDLGLNPAHLGLIPPERQGQRVGTQAKRVVIVIPDLSHSDISRLDVVIIGDRILAVGSRKRTFDLFTRFRGIPVRNAFRCSIDLVKIIAFICLLGGDHFLKHEIRAAHQVGEADVPAGLDLHRHGRAVISIPVARRIAILHFFRRAGDPLIHDHGRSAIRRGREPDLFTIIRTSQFHSKDEIFVTGNRLIGIVLARQHLRQVQPASALVGGRQRGNRLIHPIEMAGISKCQTIIGSSVHHKPLIDSAVLDAVRYLAVLQAQQIGIHIVNFHRTDDRHVQLPVISQVFRFIEGELVAGGFQGHLASTVIHRHDTDGDIGRTFPVRRRH